MKVMTVKISVILAVLIFSHSIALAQEHRRETSFCVGAGSMQQLVEMLLDIGVTIGSAGFARETTETVTPTFAIEYRYHFDRIVSLGAIFNYQRFERKLYFLEERMSTTDIDYYTCMACIDFTYLRRSIFQMYSGVALGISYASESGKDVESAGKPYLAFQVDAVGLRLGKSLAVF